MNETLGKPVLPQPQPWLPEMAGHVENALPGLWQRWSDPQWQARFEDEVRLELLRSTTLLDRQSAEGGALYPAADEIARRLSIELPLTIWQGSSDADTSFAIASMTSSVNLIAGHEVQARFGKESMAALLGHEMGHFILWRTNEGRLLTALRVLECACGVPEPLPVFVESLRRFRIFAEVFCDRVAAFVAGANPTVALLRQMLSTARETSNGNARNAQTGPLELRIEAIDIWSKSPQSADAAVARRICGPIDPGNPDLSGQHTACKITRELIDQILEPSFMQTPVAVGHARKYFADYIAPGVVSSDVAGESVAASSFDEGLVDKYLVWLLLDFLPVRSETREQALAHLVTVASRHGFQNAFCQAARRELPLSKKELAVLGAESGKSRR